MSEERTGKSGRLRSVGRSVRAAGSLTVEGAGVLLRAPVGLFKRAERRRLRTGIRGGSPVVVELPDGSFSGPAVYHLDRLDVVVRVAASVVMLVMIFWLPAPAAALVVVLGHLLSLVFRKSISMAWAVRLAIAEAVGFLLVWQLGQDGLLWVVLLLAVLGGFLYSLGSWWLDMLVVTEGKLHRLSGILWWKHTTTVSLSKVTLSESHEVFLGRGFVSFDTASSQDGRLHGWGIARHPAVWVGVVSYCSEHPVSSPSGTGQQVKGGEDD
jgi:hypothetical protein